MKRVLLLLSLFLVSSATLFAGSSCASREYYRVNGYSMKDAEMACTAGPGCVDYVYRTTGSEVSRKDAINACLMATSSSCIISYYRRGYNLWEASYRCRKDYNTGYDYIYYYGGIWSEHPYRLIDGYYYYYPYAYDPYNFNYDPYYYSSGSSGGGGYYGGSGSSGGGGYSSGSGSSGGGGYSGGSGSSSGGGYGNGSSGGSNWDNNNWDSSGSSNWDNSGSSGWDSSSNNNWDSSNNDSWDSSNSDSWNSSGSSDSWDSSSGSGSWDNSGSGDSWDNSGDGWGFSAGDAVSFVKTADPLKSDIPAELVPEIEQFNKEFEAGKVSDAMDATKGCAVNYSDSASYLWILFGLISLAVIIRSKKK